MCCLCVVDTIAMHDSGRNGCVACCGNILRIHTYIHTYIFIFSQKNDTRDKKNNDQTMRSKTHKVRGRTYYRL